MIIEKNINISISLANGIRVDKVNEPLLKKLKKAGVWFLTVAPEVGTDKAMSKIKKGFNQQEVLNVIKICKKLNIVTMSNFIIGFPWETKKDIMDTINFSKKLDTDIMNVNRLIPYPKTLLWNMTKKGEYNLLDEKRDYTDKRFKHDNLTEKEIRRFIRLMKLKFYTPKKIISITKKLKINTTIKLTNYALLSIFT